MLQSARTTGRRSMLLSAYDSRFSPPVGTEHMEVTLSDGTVFQCLAEKRPELEEHERLSLARKKPRGKPFDEETKRALRTCLHEGILECRAEQVEDLAELSVEVGCKFAKRVCSHFLAKHTTEHTLSQRLRFAFRLDLAMLIKLLMDKFQANFFATIFANDDLLTEMSLFALFVIAGVNRGSAEVVEIIIRWFEMNERPDDLSDLDELLDRLLPQQLGVELRRRLCQSKFLANLGDWGRDEVLETTELGEKRADNASLPVVLEPVLLFQRTTGQYVMARARNGYNYDCGFNFRKFVGQGTSSLMVGQRLFVLGGETPGPRESYVYDFEAFSWARGPRLNSPRFNASAVNLQNKIFILGDHKSAGMKRQVETLDLARETEDGWSWQIAGLHPAETDDVVAVAFADAVWLLHEKTHAFTETGGWTEKPPLPHGLFGKQAMVGVTNDRLYWFTEQGGAFFSREANHWTTLTFHFQLNIPSEKVTRLASVANKFIIFGDESNLEFDATSNTWSLEDQERFKYFDVLVLPYCMNYLHNTLYI